METFSRVYLICFHNSASFKINVKKTHFLSSYYTGLFFWLVRPKKWLKCQITCKSLQKSPKGQNFLRVLHLVIFSADQSKKTSCACRLSWHFSSEFSQNMKMVTLVCKKVSNWDPKSQKGSYGDQVPWKAFSMKGDPFRQNGIWVIRERLSQGTG